MLKQRIQQNLIQAVKNKESLKISVLRMLLTVILNKEKEKYYHLNKEAEILKKEELSEKSKLINEEVIIIISSEVKKRKEAILEYKKGGRKELAEKEEKEMKILQEYLPKQFSEDEIKKLVKGVIEKTGAKEFKDMGKVMAKLMPQIKGKADGSIVSKIVRELL